MVKTQPHPQKSPTHRTTWPHPPNNIATPTEQLHVHNGGGKHITHVEYTCTRMVAMPQIQPVGLRLTAVSSELGTLVAKDPDKSHS